MIFSKEADGERGARSFAKLLFRHTGEEGFRPPALQLRAINPRSCSRNDALARGAVPTVDLFRSAFHCTARNSRSHHPCSRS